eukprot:GEMP01068464.1.p3 GENE.GEMP01068464.1~~GEMP01068464.1.p3  ORF type:complete len:115 (+),score=29.57 GEMP01068464.1:75-419(+)
MVSFLITLLCVIAVAGENDAPEPSSTQQKPEVAGSSDGAPPVAAPITVPRPPPVQKESVAAEKTEPRIVQVPIATDSTTATCWYYRKAEDLKEVLTQRMYDLVWVWCMAALPLR